MEYPQTMLPGFLKRAAACMILAGGSGFHSIAHAGSGNAGETYDISLASPAGYNEGIQPGPDAIFVWQDVITHPGASYIAVHFQSFELAPGDRVVIHDGKGGQAYEMSGRGKLGAGTFWARHVKGSRLVVDLYASGRAGGNGYVIDKFSAGYSAESSPTIQAVCGTDNKANAVCYDVSHTAEYARAKSVARLLINGDTYCTGFLVSSNSDFITNEHCINSSADAVNTDFEFMSEAPTCGSANSQGAYPGIVYSGATSIMINADLDFALVHIATGNPASVYGYLKMEDRDPIVGEQIYVPQHPNGKAKEIAIFSTHTSDSGGVCRIQSREQEFCSPSTYEEVGYYADTEGGSSGAPVISSDSHRVIALHHCGDCLNRGLPIRLIKNLISSSVEDITIQPRVAIASAGPAGGPFVPNFTTYTLTNNTGNAIAWTTSTNVPWLFTQPPAGTVSAGASTSMVACINRLAELLPAGTHTGLVVFTNTGTGESITRSTVLRVGPEDYFTEDFVAGFDLDHSMLTFTPRAGAPYYEVCLSNNLSAFPISPTGAIAIALGDDDSARVNVTGGARVACFGVAYTSLFVNSNGNISFGSGDVSFESLPGTHFSLPRISVLFADLSPDGLSTISRKQTGDRVTITYQNVPVYQVGSRVNMQVDLFTNGIIRLSWLDMEYKSGIVGLSQGLGMPGDFEFSDLNRYYPCANGFADADADGIEDGWESMNGLTIGIDEAGDDNDLDGSLNREEYIADTVPTNASSYFIGITNFSIEASATLVVYPTSTARVYTIDWNSNLDATSWTPAGVTNTGSGSSLQFTVTNAAGILQLRSRVALP